MRTNALQYKCTIKTKPPVTDGEDSLTYTTKYSLIPCRYYRDKASIVANNSQMDDVSKNIKIVLKKNYNDINQWDELWLYDIDDTLIEKYVIAGVKKQRLTWPQIHHIALECKKQ